MKDGMLMNTDLTELGTVIASKELHRSSADEITVADLTGVAVQDLQISKAVFQALQ
jgi:ornithine cyclodeaminase